MGGVGAMIAMVCCVVLCCVVCCLAACAVNAALQVMIAFFISFARIATDQTSALFCQTPLDFRVATVGTVFFVSGLINFPLQARRHTTPHTHRPHSTTLLSLSLQIFLVPWLIDTFKPRMARVVGLLTAALCCLLFPSVGLLTGLVSDWVLVGMVAVYIAIKDLAYGGLGHTSNFLIVNDCLPTIRHDEHIATEGGREGGRETLISLGCVGDYTGVASTG